MVMERRYLLIIRWKFLNSSKFLGIKVLLRVFLTITHNKGCE